MASIFMQNSNAEQRIVDKYPVHEMQRPHELHLAISGNPCIGCPQPFKDMKVLSLIFKAIDNACSPASGNIVI